MGIWQKMGINSLSPFIFSLKSLSISKKTFAEYAVYSAKVFCVMLIGLYTRYRELTHHHGSVLLRLSAE